MPVQGALSLCRLYDHAGGACCVRGGLVVARLFGRPEEALLGAGSGVLVERGKKCYRNIFDKTFDIKQLTDSHLCSNCHWMNFDTWI